MLIVPLSAIPSQTLTTTLGDQVTQLNVYQKFYGVFVDVYVDNSLIIAGVIAQNLNRIVRDVYLGFKGDFCFVDTQGKDDPSYEGLGDRWQLAYLSEADLAAFGLTG